MRSRYQQGWFLMRVVKKNLFNASLLVSDGLLTSFVIPQLVDTSPHSLPSSSMMFFPYMYLCPNCSFFIRTLVIESEAYPTSNMTSA